MNFARDVVDAAPPSDRALVEIDRAGVAGASGRSARSPTAARGSPGPSQARGVSQGDVVMTLIGNRPEWVLTMVACFRIGAVALPCNEQLRAKDLRLRLAAAAAQADRRRRAQRRRADRRGPGRADASSLIPDDGLFDARAGRRRRS